MKKLILALTFSLACIANAATVHSSSEDTGIIVPEVATGVRTFSRWNNDLLGNMVVCIAPAEYSYRKDMCDAPNMPSENNRGWTQIKHTIPPGKAYAGFRTVGRGSSYYLEVYWK